MKKSLARLIRYNLIVQAERMVTVTVFFSFLR